MSGQSFAISSQASGELAFFKRPFSNFRINRSLTGQLKTFREGPQCPVSKIQRGNLSSCLFRLCPLASSFCVPSETFYLTLFWALFPQVKRFPSSLSPEYISILLRRETKGRHYLHRVRMKIAVSQGFKQCVFLASSPPFICLPTPVP